jgi:hypothetical protein
MNELFYICVKIMEDMSAAMGITYEELNVWLFVIIHPLITLLLLVLFIFYWNRYRSLKQKTVS